MAKMKQPDEVFAEGIIDEDTPAIVEAIQSMIQKGYGDDAIKRIVGATQAMVDRHRANVERQK